MRLQFWWRTRMFKAFPCSGLKKKTKNDFLMVYLTQFKNTSTLSSPEHLHVDPGLIQSTWAAQHQLGFTTSHLPLQERPKAFWNRTTEPFEMEGIFRGQPFQLPRTEWTRRHTSPYSLKQTLLCTWKVDKGGMIKELTQSQEQPIA